MILTGCVNVNPKVIYVDASSDSQHDGLTWETAYNNLQDAIDKTKKVMKSGLQPVFINSQSNLEEKEIDTGVSG